jgi:hypothetical protein
LCSATPYAPSTRSTATASPWPPSKRSTYARPPRPKPSAGAERQLLRQFARRAALPWTIATSEDLRYPTSNGQLSPIQTQFGRYTHALGNLSSHGNKHARRSTAAVYHLMAPPRQLLHPRLLAAIVRATLLGYGTPVQRPTALNTPSRPGTP